MAVLAILVALAVRVAVADRGPEEPHGEGIERMLHQAEKLERDGRMDAAEGLRRQAEQAEAKLRERGERPPRPEVEEHIGQLKRRIRALMEMAHRAEEADMPEVAEGHRHHAEELERELREVAARQEERHPPRPEVEEHVARVKKRIHVLMEMAHMAREHDMPDVAEGLARHAEELERELREAVRKQVPPGAMLDMAKIVRARAQDLQRAGKERGAAELREKAARLEAEAAEQARSEEMPPHLRELHHGQEDLRNQIRELREQLHALREEVAELRAHLREARR